MGNGLRTLLPVCCPLDSIRIWQLVSSRLPYIAGFLLQFCHLSVLPVFCLEQLVAHVARFQFISCGWLQAPRCSKSKLNAAGARIFVIGRRATNKRCCSHICIEPLHLYFCQQPRLQILSTKLPGHNLTYNLKVGWGGDRSNVISKVGLPDSQTLKVVSQGPWSPASSRTLAFSNKTLLSTNPDPRSQVIQLCL